MKSEDILEFLNSPNMDPQKVARANIELNAIKMKGNQRWLGLFAARCNKFTEARADLWDNINKISMAALSDELIKTMVGNHLMPDEYFYIDQAANIEFLKMRRCRSFGKRQ